MKGVISVNVTFSRNLVAQKSLRIFILSIDEMKNKIPEK